MNTNVGFIYNVVPGFSINFDYQGFTFAYQIIGANTTNSMPKLGFYYWASFDTTRGKKE